MIKFLEIQNFQSHEESNLEFDPGVNVIIGNSDSGKTAIIRALRWAVWNRPTGNSIQSSWGGETVITVQTEEGEVSRIKGKTDAYVLNRVGGKKLVFKAFGTSVPDEIQNFFNINEINLQQQLDAPFLLSKTSGEVASHFNKVARLSKIDTGTSNVNSWITKLKSDIGKDESDIEKFTEQLKTFEYLEKFEIDVEVLEAQSTQLTNLQSRTIKLDKIIKTHYTNADELLCYQDTLALENPINDLITLKASKKELNFKAIKLKFSLDDYRSNITTIEQEYLLIGTESAIINLLGLYTERKVQNNQSISLYKAITRIKNSKIQINTAEQNYNTLHAKFEKVFPDICPLCNKPK